MSPHREFFPHIITKLIVEEIYVGWTCRVGAKSHERLSLTESKLIAQMNTLLDIFQDTLLISIQFVICDASSVVFEDC